MSLCCFAIVLGEGTTHGRHRLSPTLELGLFESGNIGQTQMCDVSCALEQVSNRFHGDVIAWARVKMSTSIEESMVHSFVMDSQYDRCSRSRFAAASSPRSTNADMAASVS